MSNSNAIGFFDSGIGGTSIWREITSLLPLEDTIYLADSKNAPYGKESHDKIIQLCIKNTEFLLQQRCKLIVVACNTATTNAISHLREAYDVPFIGIEPAIKPAALQTKSNSIGILATKGTLSSSLFSRTSDKIGSKINIIEQVGTGLVELIENGKIHSEEMNELLRTYLTPMLNQNIDSLVLGCSHYPYLIPQIKKITSNRINIIDSGLAVARQTEAILTKFDLKNDTNSFGEHQFYSNQNKAVLQNILSDVTSSYSIQELDF